MVFFPKNFRFEPSVLKFVKSYCGQILLYLALLLTNFWKKTEKSAFGQNFWNNEQKYGIPHKY